MPSNIEIKARVFDPVRLRKLAEQLSDTPPKTIRQHDTFFTCPNGRLKLRVLSSDHGELIFYKRADVAGTKQSHYQIASTSSPGQLHAVLSEALGVEQTVTKTRVLIMAGQTPFIWTRWKGWAHSWNWRWCCAKVSYPRTGTGSHGN